MKITETMSEIIIIEKYREEIMDKLAHRKGRAVLHFQDREGKPLAGKTVEIRQKKQEFLFGCNAFDTLELCRENLDGKRKEIL